MQNSQTDINLKSMEAQGISEAAIVVRRGKNQEQRTIVVLGVERGGTSMVAGVLRAMNINMGDRAGRNHEDPMFTKEDEGFLKEQIKLRDQQHDVWGFKFPKASLMVDFYSKNLRNPHFILVFRNIAATVESRRRRNNSDPLQTTLHTLNYFHKAISDFEKSDDPVLFVNYEKANTNQQQFVETLAAFAGIELTAETKQRALAVITGDGGGYVDIPEYYFHLESVDQEPDEELDFDFKEDTQKNLQLGEKLIKDKVILATDQQFLPKELVLAFDLEADEDVINQRGVRVYFDFTDKFFPAHCYRPTLRKGRNVLKILTNGNAKRLALGPLKAGMSYGISNLKLYS